MYPGGDWEEPPLKVSTQSRLASRLASAVGGGGSGRTHSNRSIAAGRRHCCNWASARAYSHPSQSGLRRGLHSHTEGQVASAPRTPFISFLRQALKESTRLRNLASCPQATAGKDAGLCQGCPVPQAGARSPGFLGPLLSCVNTSDRRL